MPAHQFTKLRLSIFVSDCFDRGNCEGFVVVCCCCQVGLFKSFVVVFLPRRVGFERVGRGSSIFDRGSFAWCVDCSEDMEGTVGLNVAARGELLFLCVAALASHQRGVRKRNPRFS